MTARFVVTKEVELIIGKSKEEILEMNLGEFAELAFDKGYIARVGPWVESKNDGGLTISVEHGPQVAEMP